MPRTIIDIPAEQLRAVDDLCRALAISRAEAVRRGLAEFLRQHTAAHAGSFGLWQAHDDADGVRRRLESLR
jgi:metal-responsive CopG/Arc/MetJ family transcriptional regulator